MRDAPSSVPEPAIQVAARLLAEGRPSLAADRLAELVAEAPTYAAAHVLHATALEAAGRFDDALGAWGRAASLVPRSPLVHRERERLLASHPASRPSAEGGLPAVPLAGGSGGTARTGDPGDSPAEADPAGREEGAEAPVPFVPDAHDALPVVEAFPFDTIVPGAAPDDAADTDRGDAPDPTSETPAPEYGGPPPLEVSDLFFGDPFTPTPSTTPEPETPEPAEPEPEPDARPRTEGGWLEGPSETSDLLPPEGDVPRSPDPDLHVPEPLEASGWEVLSEESVPTPPHDVHAEPDVVSPEGDAPPDDAFAVADELDALIAQLEDAPRIRPDPEFRGPEVAFDEADVDEMASETLAKIYAAQHQYVEAAVIYEKLAARQPDRADEMLRLAAEMRERG